MFKTWREFLLILIYFCWIPLCQTPPTPTPGPLFLRFLSPEASKHSAFISNVLKWSLSFHFNFIFCLFLFCFTEEVAKFILILFSIGIKYYFGRCSSELAQLIPLLEGSLLVILIDAWFFCHHSWMLQGCLCQQFLSSHS